MIKNVKYCQYFLLSLIANDIASAPTFNGSNVIAQKSFSLDIAASSAWVTNELTRRTGRIKVKRNITKEYRFEHSVIKSVVKPPREKISFADAALLHDDGQHAHTHWPSNVEDDDDVSLGNGASNEMNEAVYFMASQMLQQIPPPPNPALLQVCLLDHNHLTSLSPLSSCTSLLELSVNHNSITSLPEIFANLLNLQILRMESNQITSWRSILPLKSSPSLGYLSLTGNAFAKNSKYRPFVVNLVPNLKALDSYAISDEELLENYTFPDHYKPLSDTYRLPEFIINREIYPLNTNSKNSNSSALNIYTQIEFADVCIAFISNIVSSCSPIFLIQWAYRRYLGRKMTNNITAKAAQIIQNVIRKKVMARIFKRQLDSLLIAEGHSNLLVSRREGRRVHSANVIQEGYRQLRQKRLEKKSVGIIMKWFGRKQKRFKRLLEKMGAGDQRILFGAKDRDNVIKCVIEVLTMLKKDISHIEAYEIAKTKIVETGIEVLREMKEVDVLGKDAITDGLFKFWRRSSRDGRGVVIGGSSIVRLKKVIEQGRFSEKLLNYFGVSKRACCKPNKFEVETFVSEWGDLGWENEQGVRMFKFDEGRVKMMAEVVRMINRRFPHTLLIFDGQAARLAAAVVLQSVWRSYISRKELKPSALQRVCERRARIKIQNWWRDWSGVKRRIRHLTILNKAAKRVDSKTVYIEANMFYLLTNAKHCEGMVSALGNNHNRKKAGFNKVEFGFDEEDRVNLIEFEDEVEGGEGEQRGGVDGPVAPLTNVVKTNSPIISRRSIFRKRQHMWQQIGHKKDLNLELIPDWMEWKPTAMDGSGTKLNGNIGALLLTGVELNLVPQGPLLDPDVVKKGNVKVKSIDYLQKRGVMLMCMKFKSVGEARKRVGLLAMKTFHLAMELYCPCFTFSGLEEVGMLFEQTGLGGRGRGDAGGGEDNVAVSLIKKPRRPNSVRPKSAGGRPNVAVRGEDKEECWVSGVKSPTYVKQARPQTARAAAKKKQEEGGGVGVGGEGQDEEGFGGSGEIIVNNETFEPDAEYCAQLIRLQSLITKKQKKKKNKEEAELRRIRVQETREREKALKEKRKDGRKMTDLDYAKLMKWKADMNALKFFEEHAAAEADAIKSGEIMRARVVAREGGMKLKAEKEAKEMNAAMAAMAEKMQTEKGLREEQGKREEEEQKKLEANRRVRVAEKRKKHKSKSVNNFGLHINLVNREGGKVARDLRKRKEAREVKAKVGARKAANQRYRALRVAEALREHEEKSKKVKLEKEQVNELLIQREVLSRQKMNARKLIYRGKKDVGGVGGGDSGTS
ncbi:hypothetical protein TL16_g06236 [Triparma laevis f. inornata]|uniref:Uncharacterized protein n=1 Tax=Triparma laevis f. inornata TaxID=1714386 RepID=A0A9W7EEL2_9STRA|nr:hypothetical protein TL16_g06236 [Triparma laevis f. inornata]